MAIVDFSVSDCEPAHAEAALQRGRGFARMRPAPTASERLDGPIDHEHLSRYTLGDKSLEIEVLELFDGEAPKTLSNLRNALSAVPTDGRGWHVACHTLKGSARAVGAWRVAMAAEAAERSPRDEPEKMSAHVLAIEAALAETTAYIRAYSR